MDRVERDVERLAVLGDDLRRRMYLYVRSAPGAVSREAVAGAVGVSRKLAAFHLDKLADHGLLRYRYERPPGRSGPGAGRPAKLYEPSDVEVEITIPERRYELVGTMLLDAIETQPAGRSPREHAARVAGETGQRIGEDVRRRRRLRPPGAERTLAIAEEVLREHGFEPVRRGGQILLRNCPFHALAEHAPDLVCALNQAFIAGLVRGLGSRSVDVALEPAPDRCCVVVRQPSSL